jgi:hypothetical protein
MRGWGRACECNIFVNRFEHLVPCPDDHQLVVITSGPDHQRLAQQMDPNKYKNAIPKDLS